MTDLAGMFNEVLISQRLRELRLPIDYIPYADGVVIVYGKSMRNHTSATDFDDKWIPTIIDAGFDFDEWVTLGRSKGCRFTYRGKRA